MIFSKITWRNFGSYGFKTQELNFNDEGMLINLSGRNGAGKCLSPETFIEIEIDDEEIKKQFEDFLKKTIVPD
jgi:hypothetical protein